MAETRDAVLVGKRLRGMRGGEVNRLRATALELLGSSPMIAHLASAAFLTAALAVPAVAQGPAQTGTGGDPASTIYAPNTSPVGRTMPPAAGGGARRDSNNLDRETAMERKDDKIDTGICIGCDK